MNPYDCEKVKARLNHAAHCCDACHNGNASLLRRRFRGVLVRVCCGMGPAVEPDLDNGSDDE